MLRRVLICLALPLFLAACGAQSVWAPDEAVQKAHYRAEGPPSITLFTVMSTRGGQGAHSAIMINGAERVLFDPAGTWQHPAVPERNDVHYGITPMMRRFYIDYHARETFDVVEQTLTVTPEMATRAIALVQANGATPKAMCAQHSSGILRELGFSSLPRTFYPKPLMEAFGALPGVVTKTHKDGDPANNHNVLLQQSRVTEKTVDTAF